jgi:tetratricopeptide (TPR) repeat protein
MALVEEPEALVGSTEDRWRTRLPPATYTRLFGVDATLDALVAALTDRQHAWLVVIDGLGGSGKTALAREAVLRAYESSVLDCVIWQTAQQQAFTGGEIQTEGAATSPAEPVLTVDQVLEGIAVELGLKSPALSKYESAGDLRPKRREIRAALNLAQEAEHRPLTKAAHNFLGMAYIQAGQPDAALPHLWSALEIARETGDRPGVGVILVNVGRSYLALDRPSMAMPHLQASLRITRRTDNRPAESAVLAALGDAHRALGQPDLAEGCYRQALHLARSLDDARREAQIQRAMAELDADVKHPEPTAFFNKP